MSRSKTALVTGAAVRIGAMTVRELHARGCHVLVHCNSRGKEAEILAADLNALRADSAFVAQADLSTPRGVDSLASVCRELFGKLDILVNNASRFYPTEVGQTLAWQWDDLLNSNLRGPYFLVQALLNELRAAKGCVVNIVDIHSERPMPGHAVYNISKASIAMLTKTLAQELGPEVRVNGVSPGAIIWPEAEMTEDEKQGILEKTALGRVGDPSDIASAVAYLALDAPYVTGQILAVDGGRTLNV